MTREPSKNREQGLRDLIWILCQETERALLANWFSEVAREMLQRDDKEGLRRLRRGLEAQQRKVAPLWMLVKNTAGTEAERVLRLAALEGRSEVRRRQPRSHGADLMLASQYALSPAVVAEQVRQRRLALAAVLPHVVDAVLIWRSATPATLERCNDSITKKMAQIPDAVLLAAFEEADVQFKGAGKLAGRIRRFLTNEIVREKSGTDMAPTPRGREILGIAFNVRQRAVAAWITEANRTSPLAR